MTRLFEEIVGTPVPSMLAGHGTFHNDLLRVLKPGGSARIGSYGMGVTTIIKPE